MPLTALAKKLRLQNAQRALILNSPEDFIETLGEAPEGIMIE